MRAAVLGQLLMAVYHSNTLSLFRGRCLSSTSSSLRLYNGPGASLHCLVPGVMEAELGLQAVTDRRLVAPQCGRGN